MRWWRAVKAFRQGFAREWRRRHQPPRAMGRVDVRVAIAQPEAVVTVLCRTVKDLDAALRYLHTDIVDRRPEEGSVLAAKCALRTAKARLAALEFALRTEVRARGAEEPVH